MSFLSVPVEGWIQIAALFGLLTLALKPMGSYMANVFEGERVFISPVLVPVEKGIYWLCGIDPRKEMSWQLYLKSILAFAAGGIFLLFLILVFQDFPVVSPDLALNIAISFVTNTDWQSYVPETTLTATSQMIGLAVQNFLSAAMGLSVLLALVRGIRLRESEIVGNFWVDMVRVVLYVLLPGALLLSLFLLSQGSVQSFGDLISYKALDAGTAQTIMTGPVASQMAIKELGTNGDGYYAATSAHPFENPTALTNFIQMLAVFFLPATLTYMFGKMVGNRKQGLALFFAMVAVALPLMLFCMATEQAGNPLFASLGIDQALGNMEGKEVRFGSVSSALWAAVNGGSSSGSANATFDSFMPLSSFVLLMLIQIGQIIFGGVGSGLYGLMIYVIITVFIAGLMVGRAPEFLSKRIGVREIKYASLGILIPAILTLGGTAIGVLFENGQVAATHPFAQGFSQILYAFSSASNNNGGALGGVIANTPFYNIALGICMLLARFGVIGCVLAIAGSFAEKNKVPKSSKSLDTTSPLFVVMLVFVIALLSIPAFLPSLALGPIAEHIHLMSLLAN